MYVMGRKAMKKKEQNTKTWPRLFFVFAGFSLIVLPLIHSEKVMDPTLAPRLFAWTIFLLLTTLVFSAKNLFKQLDFSVLRNPLFAIFLLIFLLSLISLFFAVNASAGFYDQVKTFSTMVYLAFACFLILNTPKWPLRLTKIFIVASLVILLIGYAQYLIDLGFGFHPRHEMIKLTGLMSNVNLYASYLMMMLPFVIYGIIVLDKNWRVLAIVSLTFLLLMIFLLQTRAVYLGILVGIPASLVLLIIHYKQFHVAASIRNGLALSLIGGGLAFAIVLITAPEDNFYVSRMRSIFTDTENPRLSVWGATSKMFADHPFTGVGAGNFTVKVQYYYGDYDLPEGQINWMRPHNDFLWVLSEKGVFALMAYLALFALAFYYIWIIIRGDSGHANKWLSLCLFMGLVAYLVNAFFDFPLERVNHQIVLSLYLASLISIVHQLKPNNRPLQLSRPYFIIPLLVLLLVATKFGHEHITQEKHVGMARNANVSQRWDLMLDAAQRAKTPWKTLDALAVPVSFFEGFAYTKLGDGHKALQAFTEAYRQNPHRKYILNNMGVLYMQNEQYDTGIRFFLETLYMFPRDIQTLNYLADAYVIKEQYQEALEMLERIPEEHRTGSILILYAHIKEMLDEP